MSMFMDGAIANNLAGWSATGEVFSPGSGGFVNPTINTQAPWWSSLITQGLQTTRDIFTARYQAPNQQPFQVSPVNPAYQQQPGAPASSIGAGVGGAFDSIAASLGISTSTLTLLTVGMVGLYLMPSPRGRR